MCCVKLANYYVTVCVCVCTYVRAVLINVLRACLYNVHKHTQEGHTNNKIFIPTKIPLFNFLVEQVNINFAVRVRIRYYTCNQLAGLLFVCKTSYDILVKVADKHNLFLQNLTINKLSFKNLISIKDVQAYSFVYVHRVVDTLRYKQPQDENRLKSNDGSWAGGRFFSSQCCQGQCRLLEFRNYCLGPVTCFLVCISKNIIFTNMLTLGNYIP